MKIHNIKKILALLIALSTLFAVFSMTSCDRKYDEQEVKEAAEKLLKNAEILNIVYYGDGIRYIENADETYVSVYREADESHLGLLGFSDIDGLKTLTTETFTQQYANALISNILGVMKYSDISSRYGRYYQEYDDESGLPTKIMVNSNVDDYKIMNCSLEYDYNSLQIIDSEGEKVNAAIEVTLTNENGKTQYTTIDFVLVEEVGGWKIDGPVFANYYE